jgi:hypothetical protein
MTCWEWINAMIVFVLSTAILFASVQWALSKRRKIEEVIREDKVSKMRAARLKIRSEMMALEGDPECPQPPNS